MWFHLKGHEDCLLFFLIFISPDIPQSQINDEQTVGALFVYHPNFGRTCSPLKSFGPTYLWAQTAQRSTVCDSMADHHAVTKREEKKKRKFQLFF